MIYFSNNLQNNFRDYLIHYPFSFQDGYDGIHHGGIKGIKKSAPQDIKDEFKIYVDYIIENKLCGCGVIKYRELDE